MTAEPVPVALELRGVGKTYGQGPTAVVALHRIDLSVSAGELLAVTGRSGSGKSGHDDGRAAADPGRVVASAAFTVDHRRRMRAGLLGAVGASSSQVVRIATWEAAGIGVAGAALGMAAGIALAAAAQPAIERLLQRSITGVGLDWVDLAWPAGFGLVAAVVAARRPARSAARVPLVVAVRGGPGKPLSAVTPRATAAALLPVALVVVTIAELRQIWFPAPLLTILGVASPPGRWPAASRDQSASSRSRPRWIA
jgi:hypothetical protein